MGVPESIRKVSRPTNTVVVDQHGEGPRRYAVRVRTKVIYVPNGNPQPRNGRTIGHIVDGRYVPLIEQLIANQPVMKSFGAVALIYSVAEDILRDLEAVYSVDEARQILGMAILRVLRPGLPMSRIQTEYHRTFVSVYYPGLSMSAATLGKLKKKLGENERKRIAFFERRIKAVMADHHVVIDGTLRQDSSTVNDLSAFSRKARTRGYKEVSILYAYDVELGEPVCATVYPGNVVDQSAVTSFIRDNRLNRGILVADKGFSIAKVRDELAQHEGVHYLFPIRRNDKRIAANKMTQFEGVLPGIDEQVLFKKVRLTDGRFLYAFRDRSVAASEEAAYLARLKKSGKTFDLEDYEKNRDSGGVIVFESDLDMDPAVAYKCYADRWQIELVFRHYQSEVCDRKTQVQGDFSVWGDEFINFISTLLTCRILRKLENAGLLEEASYRNIMDDLSSAWRRTDGALEPRSDDDAWVHTTKEVFEMLEKLGLSEPIAKEPPSETKIRRGRKKLEKPEFVGPKRPRGRPRKIQATDSPDTARIEKIPNETEMPPVKRKPGRPKGSKNKKTLEREALAATIQK